MTPEAAAHVGAEIERALERIPRRPLPSAPRLTQDAPVPLGDALGALPPQGAWTCPCGAAIERPGVCAECGRARKRAETLADLGAGVRAIPEAYEATSTMAGLRSICRPASGDEPWALAGALAATLASEPQSTVLIWCARSGAGKTSLACAVVRRMLVLAAAEAAAVAEPHPRIRLAAAEPRVCALARGARLVTELDLLGDVARGPDAPPGAYRLALRAPLLILDRLAAQTARDADATARVIEIRWAASMPTIATTHHAPERLGRPDIYGGSIHRRLVTDRAAHVVELL